MPELPEVETVVRGLRPHLLGRRIREARVLTPTVCSIDPEALRSTRVEELARRGKYVLMHLRRGRRRPVLEFHLGMSGQLLIVAEAEPTDKHVHLVLRFQGMREDVRFRDMRKLGEACFYPSTEELDRQLLSRLGPEADAVTTTELARAAWSSSRPIKPLLMVQERIAGLGNIYADEALWHAQIHPLRPSDSLSSAELGRLAHTIRSVLRDAILDRGSSVDDFRGPDGAPGRYQQRHAVYGREGEACPRCGRPISRIKLQGRSAHFCPHCQPLPTSGGGDED